MSSLRNAVKRRTHKERSQPSDRARYGLLEKHKDYVLRAKDFHTKEQTIKVLKEKAASKNPDEFYFKMINTRSIDGVHRPKGDGKHYPQEDLLLMKTQDIRYVLNRAQIERKKVEALRAVLHSIDMPTSNKHIYFAADRTEARELRASPTNVPHLIKGPLSPHITKMQNSSYKALNECMERAEKLRSMVIAMDLEKQRMGKGRKRKLSEAELQNPSHDPVYKWRQVRKK